MITFYAFGAAFGLPDASPFVMKALVLLKMSGQPYQVNTKGMFKAPKGKLPYLDDEGTVVADSTFIRWHLERQYGIDFDHGLNAEQRATAWAVEKMLEDNLYWIGVHWRWVNDANFAKVAEVFFKPVPWLVRAPVVALVRRRVRKSLHGHGMGRHSEAEMQAIGNQGLKTLTTLLGDKPYLMGEEPCGTDAMMYAILASALCAHFETPMKDEVLRHANLVAYEARMRGRFFPAK
ncbi:glutathione S-transferase family protein [Aquabacterium sp.]|uniref:glutathione S-transferase family protein n=1 Tax=Aquabacterium sp. TaxID=1872578 RepID=UPI00248702DF|nr:glutathione S-transferase family protein [Aquabacterium sp.]MDI1261605.1 glutathione S-transferase family protein [Aquabacterium sp.]